MRKLSVTLLVLSGLGALGFAGWIIQTWLEMQRADAVPGDFQAQSLVRLQAAGGLVAVYLLGWLLSFDSRLSRRPFPLLITSGFLAGATAAFGLRELYGPFMVLPDEKPAFDAVFFGLVLGCGLVPVLIVTGIEGINRVLWPALARAFDRRDLPALAHMCNRVALLFRPGQAGMLKSVALARFRKGNRTDSVEVLQSLYEAGKADADVLETLCKHASEQHQQDAYLKYLRELHELLPDEEQIRDALIAELVDQRRHREALDMMEKFGVPDEPEALERYATVLLVEDRLERATEVTRKLGDVEGIPFRRSQALLREILSRVSEYIPALNALAAQAERMAQREQRIRWLEKSYEADPRQKGVREQLITIYREMGQTPRLETLLAEVLHEDARNDDVHIEYIRVLIQNEKQDEALRRLETLSQRKDAPLESFLLEARIRFDRQEWKRAQQLVDKALSRELDDEAKKPFLSISNQIERAVLTEEVAALLNDARENPDDLPLQIAALKRLCQGGHADKVVELADNVLRRHPSSRDAVIECLKDYANQPNAPFPVLNLLCDLLANALRFDEALDIIRTMSGRAFDKITTVRDGTQRILRRAPHHLPTLRFLGDVYLEDGRYTEMIHSYSLYLSHGGEETEQMQRALATAYLSLRDYENARRFVTRLLEINPNDGALIKQVLPLAIEAQQAEDAAEYIKKLELINPRDPDLKSLRPKVQTALGERRFAFLKREFEAGKGGAETLEKLGDTARDLEHFGDAITYYQRASRDRVNAGLARRCTAKLALCYMKKRLEDLCTETLRDITISLDDDADELAEIMDILYEIGNMMLELKLYDRAERVFKQLCRIDAGYRDVLSKIEGLRR